MRGSSAQELSVGFAQERKPDFVHAPFCGIGITSTMCVFNFLGRV